MDYTILLNRFTERCKIKGVKKSFVTSSVGVRPAYFTDCKSKNLIVDPTILQSVADILDTTVAYLTGETDDPRKEATDLTEKEILIAKWFMSLPPETRKAILILGDAPTGLDTDLDH